MIQRYGMRKTMKGYWPTDMDDGEYIKYKDHAKIVKNLTDEIMHWNEKYYELEENLRQLKKRYEWQPKFHRRYIE